MYPRSFCEKHLERTGVWLPSCPPMQPPHATTQPPPTTEPTGPLNLTTATVSTTFTDLITNATIVIANTYLADDEKILPPTAIPRTSWDYFLRFCFWALLVPAVSLILLSFFSWSIWMGLKWFAPDRYEREKLVFKRGGILVHGLGLALIKMFVAIRDCCRLCCRDKGRPAQGNDGRAEYHQMVPSSSSEVVTISSEVSPLWRWE